MCRSHYIKRAIGAIQEIVCEQVLHLRKSREVTREPHVKGEKVRGAEPMLAGGKNQPDRALSSV